MDQPMTAQEELALIDEAIRAILSGGVASYSINGRSLTKLDYRMLVQRKAELEAQIAQQTGGMFVASQFRRPE